MPKPVQAIATTAYEEERLQRKCRLAAACRIFARRN